LKKYKGLTKQEFANGEYKLVPIRYDDRYEIMKWRNEQIYHLRQRELLTVEQQDAYFENVVKKLFDYEQPDQILFSFLKNDELIGYGGLVHINWFDKNAEVSFIMDTKHENDFFKVYWNQYLKLLANISFGELKLHKTFVYAFDVRPNLYDALDESGYFLDSRLREHCNINGMYKDVLIYSFINK